MWAVLFCSERAFVQFCFIQCQRHSQCRKKNAHTGSGWLFQAISPCWRVPGDAMFSCPHECCRRLPFIQLTLHSSFHGRALWWVCGRVVSSGPCQVQCASLICLKFWGWSWGSLRILVLSGRSWCCSLAFSIRAIASCGVSRLLKRCPVRTCLCSCVVPFPVKLPSKPVHWVWLLSERCWTGEKKAHLFYKEAV